MINKIINWFKNELVKYKEMEKEFENIIDHSSIELNVFLMTKYKPSKTIYLRYIDYKYLTSYKILRTNTECIKYILYGDIPLKYIGA